MGTIFAFFALFINNSDVVGPGFDYTNVGTTTVTMYDLLILNNVNLEPMLSSEYQVITLAMFILSVFAVSIILLNLLVGGLYRLLILPLFAWMVLPTCYRAVGWIPRLGTSQASAKSVACDRRLIFARCHIGDSSTFCSSFDRLLRANPGAIEHHLSDAAGTHDPGSRAALSRSVDASLISEAHLWPEDWVRGNGQRQRNQPKVPAGPGAQGRGHAPRGAGNVACVPECTCAVFATGASARIGTHPRQGL